MIQAGIVNQIVAFFLLYISKDDNIYFTYFEEKNLYNILNVFLNNSFC